MNLSFSFPTSFRENLLKANLDFDSDVFYALLMRSGFSFNSSTHLIKKNIAATTGAIQWYFVLATKTFTRNGGSFIDDGFVVGNYITTNGANNGTMVVRALTATTMRVDWVSGTALANEGDDDPVTWVTYTISCQDEMATGNGYTRGGFRVVFSISGQTLTLKTYDATYPFVWGNFGSALNSGAGILIYDDTPTNPVDPIIAYSRLSPWTMSF